MGREIKEGKEAKTLGGRLAEARQKQNISVEEAARDTHIKAERIRDIEADRLSEFSHPNYARMFLRDYARYLDFPEEELGGLLPERGECLSGDVSYVAGYARNETMGRNKRRRKPGAFLFLFLAIVLLWFAGYQIWKAVTQETPVAVKEEAVVEEETLSELASSPEPTPIEQAEPQARKAIPISDDDSWFLSHEPLATDVEDVQSFFSTLTQKKPSKKEMLPDVSISQEKKSP